MLQTYQKYSPAVRHQVCEAVISGAMSVAEAAKCYDVRSVSLIYRWLRSLDQAHHTTVMAKEKSEDPEALKARIAALEKQLELEKLRTFALDTLIDVAEDQLKIQIRKKPDTKQSDK